MVQQKRFTPSDRRLSFLSTCPFPHFKSVHGKVFWVFPLKMCLRVGVNPLFFKRNFQSLCCVRSHGRFYLSLFTRDNSKMKAPLSVFNWILPFLMASAICSQKREPSPPKTRLQRPRPRASTLLARSGGEIFWHRQVEFSQRLKLWRSFEEPLPARLRVSADGANWRGSCY